MALNVTCSNTQEFFDIVKQAWLIFEQVEIEEFFAIPFLDEFAIR